MTKKENRIDMFCNMFVNGTENIFKIESTKSVEKSKNNYLIDRVGKIPSFSIDSQNQQDQINNVLRMSIIDILNMPLGDILMFAQNFSGLLESSPELAAVVGSLKEKFETPAKETEASTEVSEEVEVTVDSDESEVTTRTEEIHIL